MLLKPLFAISTCSSSSVDATTTIICHPSIAHFGVSDIDVDTSARVHSHSALVHPWPALLRFFSSATARTSSRKSVGTTGLPYIALHRPAAAPAASIA
ncbi:hypothetical protein PaG_00385 [Moesziomyces aphidis]|jgi:hypothetical protein|uniref:Uncharacterized protein n=1 Tax=Moesziomyces aphidis TaxID=84754 RepID=W3VVU2_MOEAP|nr:hypothetical protein PaG_00385 [Moesziomyces aphidis]